MLPRIESSSGRQVSSFCSSRPPPRRDCAGSTVSLGDAAVPMTVRLRYFCCSTTSPSDRGNQLPYAGRGHCIPRACIEFTAVGFRPVTTPLLEEEGDILV